MTNDINFLIQSQLTEFNRDFLNPSTPLGCIGQGSIGGKAKGLAIIREIVFSGETPGHFKDIQLCIPSLAVIRTKVFDSFMEDNNLYPIALSDLPDERITHAFQQANLPFEILGDLRSLIEQVNTPLAIRSSSLIEDTKHEPLAGIYETKMIPNNQYNPDERFRRLVEAIKFIYASTFSKRAKDYRHINKHGDHDEKMAIIIQEVVGKRYYNRFYPELSGVARSYNYYPVKPAKPEDGVVSLALGLGKTIVDGGLCWTYSPARPAVPPPFRSAKELVDWTQTQFWMVNMGEPSEINPLIETEYLLQNDLTVAETDGTLDYLASTYDANADRLIIGIGNPGPRALTFAPLLSVKLLPFNELIKQVLKQCEQVFDSPVEVEFAMTFNPHRFNILQIRPMMVSESDIQIDPQELTGKQVLIASDNVLGNGEYNFIKDIIAIKPETFNLARTQDMVSELAQFNHALAQEDTPYLLIVLGRLGTTDPWLGIPADWGQVSGAKVIVEATQDNVVVDLSQGTHYFHNIIGQGVLYFTLANSSPYKIDWEWLNKQPCIKESHFLRHIKLEKALNIKADGKRNQGLILKP